MTSTLLPGAGISLIGPLTPTPDPPPAGAEAAPPSAGREAWDRLLDELLRVRQLPADWDGQGAEAPTAANVDRALEWVRQMRRYGQAIPPSRVVPGVQGEVYLEWQGEALYLMAEIADPSRVEWMLAVPGQPTKHWSTEGAMPYFVGLTR